MFFFLQLWPHGFAVRPNGAPAVLGGVVGGLPGRAELGAAASRSAAGAAPALPAPPGPLPPCAARAPCGLQMRCGLLPAGAGLTAAPVRRALAAPSLASARLSLGMAEGKDPRWDKAVWRRQRRAQGRKLGAGRGARSRAPGCPQLSQQPSFREHLPCLRTWEVWCGRVFSQAVAFVCMCASCTLHVCLGVCRSVQVCVPVCTCLRCLPAEGV